MPLLLREALEMVRQFHARIHGPIAEEVQFLRCEPLQVLQFAERIRALSTEMLEAAEGMQDVLLCRTALSLEELSEWLTAHYNQSLTDSGDALADRLYLLLGDAVATKLPLERLFRIVHASNMTKMPGVTNGYGRGAKGPDYHPPVITLATIFRPPSADDVD